MYLNPSGFRSRRALLSFVALIFIVTATVQAQPARLVYDIYPQNTPYAGYSGSNPAELTLFNGDLYFNVYDAYGTLSGIWRSDGTPNGTVPVIALRPIEVDSSTLGSLGNALLFVTDDALWKSDGTAAGTELVRSFDGCAGSGLHARGPLVDVGGTVFFTAYDSATGHELWKSDGTAEGTQLVKDIASGPEGSEPSFLTALGDQLFFFRFGLPPNYGELWVSDGSEPGTVLVKAFQPDFVEPVVAAGGNVFFNRCDLTSNCGLWKSDGTPGGTILLKTGDFARGTYAFGSVVLFSFDDGIHGRELWTSNGTVGGTTLVKDINPAGDSSSSAFETLNGLAYFAAQSGLGEPLELWRSDGTPAGTELVTPFGNANLTFTELRRVGPALFIGMPYQSPPELWKSDGTAVGTSLVAELPSTGGTNTYLSHLTDVHGTLVFSYDDGTYGSELWKSDGTGPGTGILKDINPEPISSSPFSFGSLHGTLLFSADDGAHYQELWKSNGTSSGTALVKDILQNPFDLIGGSPASFAALGRAALFAATSIGSGRELWKTDGTEPGTQLVVDLAPGTPSSGPEGVVTFHDSVVFSAAGGVWKSDGTGPGTVPLDSALQVYPPFFVDVGGVLYFLGAQAGQYGLWKTDGMPSGTVLVAPLNVVAGNDYPRGLTRSGNLLYFNTYAAGSLLTLWKSDGTPANTDQLLDRSGGSLTDVNGVLFFTAYGSGTTGVQLWKSDGTPGGTEQVTSVAGPWPWGPSPSDLTAVNGTLFFSMDDCAHGRELWKSDGTPGAAVLVKDIWPGPASSSPRDLVNVGSHVLFAASDPALGEELWKSDGTELGTLFFQDIESGPGSSVPIYPQHLIVRDRLYFTAWTETTGAELWSLPTAMVTGLAVSPTAGSAAGGTVLAVSGNYSERATVDIGGSVASDVAIGSPSYLTAMAPALVPGTLNDVTITNPAATMTTIPQAWFADFLDVSSPHPFHDSVETMVRAGITAGCGGGNYCPLSSVTRAQMAVFLVKAKFGAGYEPPVASGTVFGDVPADAFAAAYIEQLAALGVTTGCGGGDYCPGAAVTRAQMAVFLLKTGLGEKYTPPPATGIFADVPVGSFAADWIEDLYTRAITGGCSVAPPLYCPDAPNNRGQMAVFLVKTFGL